MNPEKMPHQSPLCEYISAERMDYRVIVLYDYCPGRSGDYPIEFLKGYSCYIHCDGYAAYGRIEDVMLLCCLAHCRRKFFEAIPKERRNKVKLLDINSDQSIPEPAEDPAEASGLLPAERGVAFCNRLFFLERCYKDLSSEDRNRNVSRKNRISGTVSGTGLIS